MNTSHTKILEHRGYALLFAVLVSAVVLGVGVSILNIARKEILLTSGAQQSKYALYAADAGYECALYQDLKQRGSAFTSTSSATTFTLSECGATYPGTIPSSFSPTVTENSLNDTNPNETKYQFIFSIPVSNGGASQVGTCAAVTITKTYTIGTDPVTGSSTLKESTQVLSDGFNVGWNTTVTPPDCSLANASKVERALLATY